MHLDVKTVDKVSAIIVATVALVVAVGALTLGLRQRASGQHRQAILEDRLETLEGARSALRELQTLQESAQADLDKVSAQIPESRQMGEFIERLAALARERRVALADVQPEEAHPEGPYARVPIRLTCTGAFPDVYDFVYELENMERLMKTERVKINAVRDGRTCRVEIFSSLFER